MNGGGGSGGGDGDGGVVVRSLSKSVNDGARPTAEHVEC